jgi:hypothetical protein
MISETFTTNYERLIELFEYHNTYVALLALIAK